VLPSLDSNVASVREVVVAFGKKVGRGLVPLHGLCPAGPAPRQQLEGTSRIAYRGETCLLERKEAFSRCMDMLHAQVPGKVYLFH
jgi:hypothetical protein